MHCLRNAESIASFLEKPIHPELHRVITERMTELAEYADFDISELVNFLVADPSDSLDSIEKALGFPMDRAFRPWESFVSRECWHEIVYVLGDDGFGIVLFIPTKDLKDSALSDFCTIHSVSIGLDP